MPYEKDAKWAQRFYSINHFLCTTFFKPKCKFPSQGYYLIKAYGWIPEFHRFACEYQNWFEANRAMATGKYTDPFHILMRKGIRTPVWSHSMETEVDWRGSIEIDINRTGLLREVQHYLNAEFGHVNMEELSLTLQSCFEQILNGTFGFSTDAVTKEKLRLHSASHDISGENDDVFYRLAVLLVFAQIGSLPGNQETPKPNPNIYMDTKGEIQRLYSLEERSLGAKRLTLINFAGTSLLIGREASYDYRTDWEQFLIEMQKGKSNAEIIVVLTDPNSNAAQDAIQYKMRSRSLRQDTELSRVIPANLEKMVTLIKNYPEWNLRLHTTDVALPCAYFRSEFQDPTRDNIKIDLYLPIFSSYGEIENHERFKTRTVKERRIPDDQLSDDEARQSFIVFRKTTPDLYASFSKNMDDIIAHSKEIEAF